LGWVLRPGPSLLGPQYIRLSPGATPDAYDGIFRTWPGLILSGSLS